MLGKQGVKYDKQTLQTLLLLCKRNGMRVTYFNERWEEVVQTWVAATMGDKIATKSLTTGHLAQNLLTRSKADGEVTSAAAATAAWLRDLLLNTSCFGKAIPCSFAYKQREREGYNEEEDCPQSDRKQNADITN